MILEGCTAQLMRDFQFCVQHESRRGACQWRRKITTPRDEHLQSVTDVLPPFCAPP
jgi:hypothetical protein